MLGGSSRYHRRGCQNFAGRESRFNRIRGLILLNSLCIIPPKPLKRTSLEGIIPRLTKRTLSAAPVGLFSSLLALAAILAVVVASAASPAGVARAQEGADDSDDGVSGQVGPSIIVRVHCH